MKTPRNLLIAFTSASLSLILTAPLQAQTTATEQHNHGHDENAASALSLDQGKKWQTDAALRQGMQSIHDAVMNNVDAFHHNKLTKPDAEKLAKHINDQVTYMVTNCKLEPKADATLHVIIGELLSGADTLAKEPVSNNGLPTIVKALQQYPVYFDHKGWAGVEH